MSITNGVVLLLTISLVACVEPDTNVNNSVWSYYSFKVIDADGILQTWSTHEPSVGGRVSSAMSRGYFLDTDGRSVWPTSLMLNDLEIPRFNQDGDLRDTIQGWRVWKSSGGSNVPAFIDSVWKPEPFWIISPKLLGKDSVRHAGGDTVRWSPVSADSVLIRFQYDALLSRTIDSTITFRNYPSVQVVAPNTGSFIIPANGFLKTLPATGVMLTYVVAYNEKMLQLNGRTYVLQAGSSAHVESFLK